MKNISKLMLGSKNKITISSIGVLALIVFAIVVLTEATKAEVVFAKDGNEQTVRTHTNTVGELLQEMDIEVGEHDVLSHHKNELLESGMKINYEPANQVTVTINGDEHTYYTTEDTVDSFLEEQEMSLTDHDELSLDRDEPVEDGLNIEISKAFEVTVNDGGEENTVWTTGGTVEDLLGEEKITYEKSSNDKIKPKLSEEVTKDTTIEITRVTKTTDEVVTKIPYDIEKEEDDSLYQGEEKVTTPGQEGTVVKKYEITLENGEEVNRELISEDIEEESVNQVVTIGTKEPEPEPVQEQQEKSHASTDTDRSADVATMSNSAETENESGGNTLTVTASAYTSSCGGCSGQTATGINLATNPNQKVIAVDPNVIPLGSKVHVEGYGEAIAADTGGAISGNRIDVHVPSKDEANNWGKKSVQVTVLD